MSNSTPRTARPSYASGFARNAAESAYPGLWVGLTGAWVPALGATGKRLIDLSGRGNDGTCTGTIWTTEKGPAITFDTAGSDSVNFGPNANILSELGNTFILHYEKTDGTNRASSAFGTGVVGGTVRTGVHLPFSDGIIYFDYGDFVAPNRLTFTGATFGNDVWAFRAGHLGSSIWQNGIRLANQTTALARTNNSTDWLLGFYGSTPNDLARTRVFLVYNRELSDDEIYTLSHDPLAPFTLKPRHAFFSSGGQILEHELEQSLNLVQTVTLTSDRLLSISDPITFVQTAVGGTIQAASNELELEDVAEGFLFPGNIQHLSHTLGLVQTVLGDNASVEELEHNLGLVQTVTTLGPIYQSLSTIMGLEHQALGTLGVPWLPLEIEHSLGLTHIAGRGLPNSASNAIVFAQSAFIRQEIAQAIAFVQTATCGFGESAAHELNLVQTATVNANFLRTIADTGILTQSLTYFLAGPCDLKQYSRFAGEGENATIAEEPLLFRSDFILESVAGTTVRLRSPEMDDIDRLGFNRVNRETRGGEINIYSDPAWPKINTLLVTIVALKKTKVDELHAFLASTLGQTIFLHDWQGRSWRGVATTPSEAATEDGRDAWTVSFEFEGVPYAGQAVHQNMALTQNALAIGPVAAPGNPGAISFNQTASYVLVPA